MKCQSDIEKLAEQKLISANCLLDNGQYDKATKEIYRPYKNHDYEVLILLSGMQTEFSAALEDLNFMKKWSEVNKWTQQSRCLCDQHPDKVKQFVLLTSEICIWIKKHL
jgi:hypothetical protein